MKKALVTGITGQDGSYLAELLLDKGYRVYGMRRRSSTSNLGRLDNVINHSNFEIVEGEVADSGCVYSLVDSIRPDEIYNLAAQSHVGTSFEQPDYTFQVNALGPLYFLEAIKHFSLDSRFYQASTSEMFGKNYTLCKGVKHQCEETPFMPQSPYAVAKTNAHHLVRIYREAYGVFGCCGILFNHESERRGENFVTRKITKWIGEFVNWIEKCDRTVCDLRPEGDEIFFTNRFLDEVATPRFPKLRLGNLDAYRDWGHAADYVKAMWLMLQQDKANDLVIATGKTYSIREFLDEAFSHVGGTRGWEDLVVIDPKFYRPAEVEYLRGSPARAREVLGWEPEIDFKTLVAEMIRNDLHVS